MTTPKRPKLMKPQSTAPLTAKQDALAVRLASGWSLKAAAAEVGISERQAHAWKAEVPAFSERVDELRGFYRNRGESLRLEIGVRLATQPAGPRRQAVRGSRRGPSCSRPYA